jgi:feruloyl esterase
MDPTLAGRLAVAAPRLTLTPVFGANPGALRMWSYAPPGLPPGAPMVVILHGCGQSAEGFARGLGWLTLADRLGFAVLAPEQTRANNPARCFNWFEPGDIARGCGEAASIRAQIERMFAVHRLDRRRVFVTGLSAGGCMALALLAVYPEVFAAGAVIAAAPFGSAASVPEAMMVMARAEAADGSIMGARVRAAAGWTGRWPRLAIWHGEADHTVAPANAHAIVAQWLDLHGLPPTPTRVERTGPVERLAWEDLAGDPVVELDLVAGLGHGAPLAAAGPDGVGRAAPFLLEAGVSSTQRIAGFFHLGRRETVFPPAPPVSVAGTPPPGRLRRLWSRLSAALRF